MTDSSNEAKHKKKFMHLYRRICDEHGISNHDQMELFCELIKSYSKKKVDVIKHNEINKIDFEEILKEISKRYINIVPMKKRDIERCSQTDKNVILNAIAIEYPYIMKEIADNFHNLHFYSKLNNPEEFIKKWKQKVELIQSRTQNTFFPMCDLLESSDQYDNAECDCFGDWTFFC